MSLLPPVLLFYLYEPTAPYGPCCSQSTRRSPAALAVQVQVGQWPRPGVAMANRGGQAGGSAAPGTRAAPGFGRPGRSVGGAGSVRGLCGAGGAAWGAGAVAGAGAASRVPAGPCLRGRLCGEGPALPGRGAVSAQGSGTVELLLVDVWVSSSSSSSFSSAPAAGSASHLFLESFAWIPVPGGDTARGSVLSPCTPLRTQGGSSLVKKGLE